MLTPFQPTPGLGIAGESVSADSRVFTLFQRVRRIAQPASCMPRPELHDLDSILDAARAVVLDNGRGAATVAAIAEASGAPIGSIYHRFGSVDDLLAEMWIRAVRRSQARFTAAAEQADPIEAAVGAALSVYDFCVDHPADARLLVSLRLEDLAGSHINPTQRAELERLNEPVEAVVKELARRIYGRASRRSLDRVIMAVFDLSYGAVRRPLATGEKLSRDRREAVEAAVRAVLADAGS
jgi:AcrR family transcriptional regulator